MISYGELNTLVREASNGALNRVSFWTSLLHHLEPVNMAEVGVWKGDFARLLLESQESIQKYLLIDPWRHLENWSKPWNVSAADFENIYAEAKQNVNQFKERVIFLRGTFREIASNVEDESLDVCYIDGDHSLRGIVADLEIAFQKVRDGGLIAGDDLTKGIWQHGTDFDPSMVFPYVVFWAEAKGLPIWTTRHRQFLIWKDDSLGFLWTDFDSYKKVSTAQLFRDPGTNLKSKRALSRKTSFSFTSLGRLFRLP